MPEDIENYIHRIGRTGRGNHQGVATTFVNSKSCDKSILLDLKGTFQEFRIKIRFLGKNPNFGQKSFEF